MLSFARLKDRVVKSYIRGEAETRAAVPERAEELRGVVFEELRGLQADGPSQEDVEKVVEAEKLSLEANLQLNPYWAVQLMYSREADQDPRFLLDGTRYDNVSRESIQQDAQLYLNEEQVVIVVLLPVDKIG